MFFSNDNSEGDQFQIKQHRLDSPEILKLEKCNPHMGIQIRAGQGSIQKYVTIISICNIQFQNFE